MTQRAWQPTASKGYRVARCRTNPDMVWGHVQDNQVANHQCEDGRVEIIQIRCFHLPNSSRVENDMFRGSCDEVTPILLMLLVNAASRTVFVGREGCREIETHQPPYVNVNASTTPGDQWTCLKSQTHCSELFQAPVDQLSLKRQSQRSGSRPKEVRTSGVLWSYAEGKDQCVEFIVRTGAGVKNVVVCLCRCDLVI